MDKWKLAAAGTGLLLVTSAIELRAEHTRFWRQSTYEDFMKGTAHGVAVRSDGRLELAPRFTELADADASFLWALRQDAQGTVYTAGGSPAKVFRLEENGKLTSVFESTELSAQAVAFDAKGALYVGTSPDGKVYRVSKSGEKSVFFDPKMKYIWDLAFGPDGTLYVATGDKGQIFAVTSEGKGQLFYASDEAHIRVLAFDAKGNVIAGTEPSGRVLRLTRVSAKTQTKGEPQELVEGFVLYETPKREVTALTTGPDGSIYAGAIGEKPRKAVAVAPTVIAPAPAATGVIGGGTIAVTSAQAGMVPGQVPFAPFPPLLTSSIYKISEDGAPEELWSSREEVVYSLGIGSDGRLLAGTGNNGALLAIDARGVFSQIAKGGSAQVTGILRGSSGKVFLCTANPGKLIALGPEYEKEGTFESRSFDTELFSRWGRLEWWSPPLSGSPNKQTDGAPRLEFFVRSGNTEDPGKEWSQWHGPYATPGSAVEAPAARFVQWKAVIHDGRPGDGIEWVSLAYQPRNVPPVIDGISLQDPGVRAQSLPMVATGQSPTVALKVPPGPSPVGGVGIVVAASSGSAPKFEAPPQGYVQKGWQSLLWSAHDENDDELRFAVYYRGEAEQEWKLLKDKLDQRFYAFDTTSLPDGAYYLKIVADDSPSNPPEAALKAERESERFLVDNTPPAVAKLEVSAKANRGGARPSFNAHVTFTAKDNASSISRAQYSLDGKEWIFVVPRTGISDSREESYDFTVPGLEPGEHTIAVRVYDQFDNVGSGKATLTTAAATGVKP